MRLEVLLRTDLFEILLGFEALLDFVFAAGSDRRLGVVVVNLADVCDEGVVLGRLGMLGEGWDDLVGDVKAIGLGVVHLCLIFQVTKARWLAVFALHLARVVNRKLYVEWRVAGEGGRLVKPTKIFVLGEGAV